MPTVGGTLSSERIRQGLELSQIASATKISTRALMAIEADDFDKLPAVVFTRNFIRQYADVLHVDPEPLVKLYDSSRVPVEQPLPNPQPIRKSPRVSRLQTIGSGTARNATGAFVGFIATIAICTGAYYGYQFFISHRPVSLPRAAAARPAVRAAVPDDQPTPIPASVAEAAPPQGVQAEITAVDSAWIRVTADGKNVFTGVLQVGESRTFQGVEKIAILAGNAGGIALKLNGKDVPGIGPKGQVRTVDLTMGGAQVRPKAAAANPQS